MTDIDTHRLEQLAIERAKLTSDRDALIERIAELDHLLASSLDKGTHTVGDHKVTITIPERTDAKLLEAAYPVAQHPTFYKRAIDLEAIKQNLSPADLQQYKVAGRPSVRVK